MTNKIFKGTFIGLLSKGVGIINTIILTPLMLHQMGSEGYGLWMTMTSMLILLGFTDLGINNNLMNVIATNLENKQTIKKYIALSYTIQFIVLFFLLLCLLLIYWGSNKFISFNWRSGNVDLTNTWILILFLFLLSLFSNTIYAIQRGLQKSITANTWQLCANVFSLLFLYFILVYQYSVKAVVFGIFGIPVLIGLINSVWFLKKYQLIQVSRESLNAKETFRFFRSGLLLLYLQVAALFAFQTDTLILARYVGFDEVSRFNILTKVFTIPTAITAIYFQILWPAYAQAFANKNWVWIKRTFRLSLLFSTLIILLFCIAIYYTQQYIFHDWLKSDWIIPSGVFISFAVLTIIMNIDNNIAILMNGLQVFKMQVVWSLLMVVINLGLSLLLVKSFAIQGVLLGTIIATVIFSIIPFGHYIHKLFR